jgi:DNA adenine methylase
MYPSGMDPAAPEPRPRDALPRPFLKWAGGKAQLLPVLLRHVREAGAFRAYHEPFVGGGALFFELTRLGVLDGRRVRLADVNPNLIETYRAVRDDVGGVIERLREHRARHGQEHYYAVRAEEYEEAAARAARVIYLNRTCFNGLYRENRRGRFNVPMGRYRNPAICDEPTLRAASEALRDADLAVAPFQTVLDHAEPGDLVYFDPPYHPVSETASFTAYARNGFGRAEQETLAEVCRALDARDVRFILSNSSTDFTQGLYWGFRTAEVSARRSVNSRADRRDGVPELIVDNPRGR